MRELLLVAAIFFGLAGIAWAVQNVQVLGLMYGGIILVLAGLVFSTPCAIWYHVLLYRALKPRGVLDKRWLWNPTGQHKWLLDDERARVLPWFYAGAAGWGASIVGCVLLAIAALMMRRG